MVVHTNPKWFFLRQMRVHYCMCAPPVSDAYGWLVVSQLPLSAVIHTNGINLVSLARQNITTNTFDLINVDGSGC